MKKFLPDLIAILAFILISFVYFFPADIENRILFQHDIAAGAGAGQEAKEYYEQTGERTRWTNSIFGGMPTYQIAPSYDTSKPLQWVQKVYQLFLPNYVSLTFILACRIRRNHVGILLLLFHINIRRTPLEVHHSCLHTAYSGRYCPCLPRASVIRWYCHCRLHCPTDYIEPRTDVLLLPVRHPLFCRGLL